MTATTNAVTIGSATVSIVEYSGQRVVTLKMVDELHGRAEGTARKRFNDNKSRLTEGEDYFVRNSDEAREMGFTAPNGLVILTESGYLMLVKSFTDDLAWKVQKELVRSYFRPATPATPAIPKSLPDALRLAAELEEARLAAEAKIKALAPKADALDELASLDGRHNIRDSAKQCGWTEAAFVSRLMELGWLYKSPVTGRKCAKADKIKAGYMDVKNVPIMRSTGLTEGVGQPMITQKGLARLRVLLGSQPGKSPANFPKAPEPAS
ncbi:MAG: phage antirepressor KilAC domain-containing protein [Acetobacter sp.]|uniref:phage antirepressor KilAC domain-containing protein n=1 Tax=Acetobacter sp. TaxID=440 RepID=UPI0039E80BC7